MKILNFCFFYFISYCLYAQANASNQHQVLNQYMRYSNELVHASVVMSMDFEYLSLNFRAYHLGEIPSLSYRYEDVLNNYDFYPVLPADLYQGIIQKNIYLSYKDRGRPLAYAQALRSELEQLDSLRQFFLVYIGTQAYRQDPFFRAGYGALEQAARHYERLFWLQDSLHQTLTDLNQALKLPPRNADLDKVLRKLEPLAWAGRDWVAAPRRWPEQAEKWQDQYQTFTALVKGLETQAPSLLQALPPEDLASAFAHRNRLPVFLQAAQALEQIGQKKLGRPLQTDALGHSGWHHFYQNDLLPLYNRYGDGMITLWNKILLHSGEWLLLQPEWPPIFEPLYPDLPGFQANTKPRLPEIDWENPSFEGQASKHLILVLDASTSMQDRLLLPQVLPQLVWLMEKLRPQDLLSVIVFSDQARLLLKAQAGGNPSILEQVFTQIQYKASTQSNQAALELAYQLAQEQFIEGGNNRIMVFTDGDLNLNDGLKKIMQKERQRIYLSLFYCSKEEYRKIRDKLEDLAQLGGGNYRFMDKKDARKQLLLEAFAYPR